MLWAKTQRRPSRRLRRLIKQSAQAKPLPVQGLPLAKACLNKLPQKSLLAFEMYYFGQYRIQAIAAHLSINRLQVLRLILEVFASLSQAYGHVNTPELRQAFQGLIELLESPKSAHFNSLNLWCNSSAIHLSSWQTSCAIWQTCEALPCSLLLTRHTPKAPYYLIATCLLVLISSLFLAHYAINPKGESRLSQLVLEDATRVELARHTHYHFAHLAQHKLLTLSQGAVYVDGFALRPGALVIRAGVHTISATGAKVEVLYHPSELVVNILAGHTSVSLDTPDSELVLIAGQQLRYRTANQQIQIRSYPIEQMALWRNGLMWADNEPIAHVVEHLDRQLPGWTLIQDTQLAHTTASGLFRTQQPEQALRILFEPLGVQVVEYGPWLRLVKRP